LSKSRNLDTLFISQLSSKFFSKLSIPDTWSYCKKVNFSGIVPVVDGIELVWRRQQENEEHTGQLGLW